MSKKKKMRKPKPSIPRWAWLDLDGCWCCKNENNCGNCKVLKQFPNKKHPKSKQIKEKYENEYE